jgi:predicted transcriptional regulator
MDVMAKLGEGPKSPTKLMYTTNLSWTSLQETLNVLIEKGLAQETQHSYRKRLYTLTSKGTELMTRYKDFLKEIIQIA